MAPAVIGPRLAPCRDRTRLLFATLDFRAIEVLYTFLTMAWGIWLLMPWATFASSPAYGALASLAREEMWGASAIVIGFTRVTGLLYENYPLRILAATGGSVIWTMTWIGIALHDWRSVGVVVYLVLSLVCGWIAVRLIREYRGVLARR